MNIFLKPETIAYSWPSDFSMNLAFMEDQAKGFAGDVLSVQVDQDQAHAMIRELWEFCRKSGHPLYQHEYTIKNDARICGHCGIRMIPPGWTLGKCPACNQRDIEEAQKTY